MRGLIVRGFGLVFGEIEMWRDENSTKEKKKGGRG